MRSSPLIPRVRKRRRRFAAAWRWPTRSSPMRSFSRSFPDRDGRRSQSRGARVQRPLWASTSAKNPAYRDVVYVEDLIGPDTVNTMPPATITAFADHGVTKRTVDTNIDEERALIAKLEKFGVSLNGITDTLLRDGLASFEKSFDTLIAGLEAKRRTLGAAVATREQW